MSWCTDAPEDEAISLFAGLLANPDVPLDPRTGHDTCSHSVKFHVTETEAKNKARLSDQYTT
jgi:hypothetical protein